MAETIEWQGASGHRYTYYIHDMSFDPNAGQDGNYIFARKVSSGWEAVYVGQGDLKDRRNAAINDGCVDEKGATQFHCHNNSVERNRKAEESDVLGGNPEAYVPTGCNEKIAG